MRRPAQTSIPGRWLRVSKPVRLVLTHSEADAVATAIEDSQANIANGWDVPAREVAALERARAKLDRARVDAGWDGRATAGDTSA